MAKQPAKPKYISPLRSVWAARRGGAVNIVIMLVRVIKIDLHQSKAKNPAKLARLQTLSRAVTSGKYIDYHDMIAFGGLGQWIFDYVKPGMHILVIGQLEVRRWASGTKKRTQIVVRQCYLAPAWSKYRSYECPLVTTKSRWTC